MTYQQIARVLDLPQSSAQVRASQHLGLLLTDEDYAGAVARLASDGLQTPDNP